MEPDVEALQIQFGHLDPTVRAKFIQAQLYNLDSSLQKEFFTSVMPSFIDIIREILNTFFLGAAPLALLGSLFLNQKSNDAQQSGGQQKPLKCPHCGQIIHPDQL